MAPNVTEKDKTLQEIIDWCKRLEDKYLWLSRALLSPLFRREAPSFRAGRNCVPLFDYYAPNVIIIGMTQKVCIERVEVRGAAPYLGMCVDTVGREMPVWSDNPQVVLD